MTSRYFAATSLALLASLLARLPASAETTSSDAQEWCTVVPLPPNKVVKVTDQPSLKTLFTYTKPMFEPYNPLDKVSVGESIAGDLNRREQEFQSTITLLNETERLLASNPDKVASLRKTRSEKIAERDQFEVTTSYNVVAYCGNDMGNAYKNTKTNGELATPYQPRLLGTATRQADGRFVFTPS